MCIHGDTSICSIIHRVGYDVRLLEEPLPNRCEADQARMRWGPAKRGGAPQADPPARYVPNRARYLVELDPAAHVGLVEFVGIQLQLADLLGREVDLVSRGGLRPGRHDSILADAVEAF
jgi:hypothetical protein